MIHVLRFTGGVGGGESGGAVGVPGARAVVTDTPLSVAVLQTLHSSQQLLDLCVLETSTGSTVIVTGGGEAVPGEGSSYRYRWDDRKKRVSVGYYFLLILLFLIF